MISDDIKKAIAERAAKHAAELEAIWIAEAERVVIARCQGSCHYDLKRHLDKFYSVYVYCRNCGEPAEIGCSCKNGVTHCAPCHYEIVGGGYLVDHPRHKLRCVHCGRTALID
jgi:hypothetical protein